MQPAETLADLYKTVNPNDPLPPNDSRYIDFCKARGSEDFASYIARRVITAEPPNFHQRLITGHRGSGKSTELKRLEASLAEAGFLVAFLDVEITLDLADLEYLDILLAIAYQLYVVAYQNKLKISDQLLRDVEEWFSEIITIREEHYSDEINVGFESRVGVEIPLLARLLATATGQMRSGSVARKEIRQKLNQRLGDLLNRLTLLIDNVTEQTRQAGFKGVVVIVDSIEKMPLKMLNEFGLTNQSMIFIEHAEQLRALPCHLILTVPVSLLSDRNLGIAFTDIDPIPMVKIFEHNHVEWPEGRDLLFQSVVRRAVIENIFQEPDLVYQLIDVSGGVIRDLMRLLLFAADYTSLDDRISERGVKRAIQKLIREYDRLIHQDDLETLQAVSKNPYIPTSSSLAKLMYNRLVLQYYNADSWVGLHPAIQGAPKFRKSLDIQPEDLDGR